MKIKYLGTAAAEGFPALFCDCEKCKKARKAGGKNIRTRSQAIIDGKLLIDYPPDTYWHLIRNDINILDVPDCVITHEHSDHFFPMDMEWMRAGFSHPPAGWHFRVYGSSDIEKGLGDLPERTEGILQYVRVKAFEPFQIGSYTITALKALHGTENPYIYMISDGEKTILYAHDTDIFPDETMEYLRKTKPYFHAVSLDCTEGAEEELPYQGHMCLGSNRKCREILNEMGVTDSRTRFILNHFSHNGLNAVYDEFQALAAKEGFITSYDGMEMEV